MGELHVACSTLYSQLHKKKSGVIALQSVQWSSLLPTKANKSKLV